MIAEQLRRIAPGMTKNQVRELISYPHFSEGLFGPREWNYIFNFRTGKGAEFEARLRYTGIDEILEAGLHSRLTEFIDTVRELARAIHRSYLEVV